MYRSSPFRSNLNTGYITTLDMCEVCTQAVHPVAMWTRVTVQLWTCVKYVPKQSIPWQFERRLHYTALDMCEVCTQAVHPVAMWTRVTVQLWTCVKYVPKQSIPWQFERRLHYTALDMCENLRNLGHATLWTRKRFDFRQSSYV